MHLKIPEAQTLFFFSTRGKTQRHQVGRKLHPWGGKRLRVKCTTALWGCAGHSGAAAGVAEGSLPRPFADKEHCEHFW